MDRVGKKFRVGKRVASRGLEVPTFGAGLEIEIWGGVCMEKVVLRAKNGKDKASNFVHHLDMPRTAWKSPASHTDTSKSQATSPTLTLPCSTMPHTDTSKSQTTNHTLTFDTSKSQATN